MKSFACGDVVPGCDATFTAASDDEILAAVGQHAAEAHDMPSVPESVADAVRARIADVA